MAYGDSQQVNDNAVAAGLGLAAAVPEGIPLKTTSTVDGGKSDHPLLGDLLGLLSSFACGFYEVRGKTGVPTPVMAPKEQTPSRRVCNDSTR